MVQGAWVQGVPTQTEGGMGCECRCGGHKWRNPWCECGHKWPGGAVDGVRGEV